MSTATLAGLTVGACSVHLPAWGVWWADVEVDSATALAGSVTLSLPGLELVGTVVSGGVWQGHSRYRIAGGAGAWGTSIAKRSYSNDPGVRVAIILGDAAADCGEVLDAAGSTETVGGQWVREAGPASRQLHLLAPRAWYVGEDGVTRLGARTASTYAGSYTTIRRDEALDELEIAADDLTGLVPGVTVDGVEAVDVVHTLTPKTLRTTLWGDRGASARLPGAIGRIIDALLAATRYRGLWSYRVVAQTGERLDLQVERASSGLPDLQRVRVRYPAGVKADHALGSMVLVGFVDGLASRPVVVAGDDPDSPGFAPSEMTLVGEDDTLAGAVVGTGRALRYGDTCYLPVGQPPTPTAVVLIADPTAPAVSVSRVYP